MKWKVHQYFYKIFPKLLNLTSTALVLAKKPDKADDEEKQEEDNIKSFLLLPTLDKQNGESDDLLLLAETLKMKFSSNGHQITFNSLWKLNPETVRDVGDRVWSWNPI